jgi:pimeloyl-ACP methyl ester carboxylesterase
MSALENPVRDPTGTGIRQERIQAGNLAFNVAQWDQARPLLFLLGWPEFWLLWDPIKERLGDGFELIAPDLRGCDIRKPFPGIDSTATAESRSAAP